MPPFLMTMASDSDHWLFISSNGGMTAGRVNPDKALFPYYTQDKLEDMSESSGSRTLIRVLAENGELTGQWQPFTKHSEWSAEVTRTIRKNLYGNHIELEEWHSGLGLRHTVSWRPSGRFGLVRMVCLRNTGDRAIQLQLLDGLQNILPPGVNQRFLNAFSNLANAYKHAERDPQDNLALYHLSSVPTDLAEPKESLLANCVWKVGFEDAVHLISDAQMAAFQRTGRVTEETYLRARRGAYLMVKQVELLPGEQLQWYICADVEQDARKIEELKLLLKNEPDLAGVVEQDCKETEQRLSAMLATADGLQQTADRRKVMRHTSNTLFNIMRGGTFLNGYNFPLEDLQRTIAHFNRQAVADFNILMEGRSGLTCLDLWNGDHSIKQANPDLARLLREYLPLSFSRRHGDPSRPWNRFSIEIRNRDGSPNYSYQGNWRDIFQNWEALVHSFPEYCEAMIFRFLNATTADGYNPYRLTKGGFDWEVIDPHDAWANIGYWGDHQIIYLLKLLEASIKFHPGRLSSMLDEESFVYADVPYRIRRYEEVLRDPRETVDYDMAWEKRIREREKRIGADGKLAHAADNTLLRVSLLEKLLSPLVAKLSNYIPDAGIWMNTQRPEWNDANNALVGYGVSVITMAYISRYLKFLLDTLENDIAGKPFSISCELADLLQSQSGVFGQAPISCDPLRRKEFMDQLGIPASQFRCKLYDNGLSGDKRTVPGDAIIAYLRNALDHVDLSLRGNKRPDALWHAYNLVRYDDKQAEIDRLKVMLEGQVAILSAGILGPSEVIDLLQALRDSSLYRKDQNSYILYPDKNLPLFLNKNRITPDEIESIAGLVAMTARGDDRIVSRLQSGDYAFNGNFHNACDLQKAMMDTDLSMDDQQTVLNLFEKTFNHHAFTGRSGTFFAYEGLGSIYWHMVSKLALAAQENFLSASCSASSGQQSSILEFYRDICNGLGIHKDPHCYGAFPTDAYSHTPAHVGAQQPGMTGQVKEDILMRLCELGLRIVDGCITFHADMLDPQEFLQGESCYRLPDSGSGARTIPLPPNSLAFSFCGVPVIYSNGATADRITIFRTNGVTVAVDDLKLNQDLSREIFERRGSIDHIRVDFAGS